MVCPFYLFYRFLILFNCYKIIQIIQIGDIKAYRVTFREKFQDAWLQLPVFQQCFCQHVKDRDKTHCKYSINPKFEHIRAHMVTKKHVQYTVPFDKKKNKLIFKPTVANAV